LKLSQPAGAGHEPSTAAIHWGREEAVHGEAADQGSVGGHEYDHLGRVSCPDFKYDPRRSEVCTGRRL